MATHKLPITQVIHTCCKCGWSVRERTQPRFVKMEEGLGVTYDAVAPGICDNCSGTSFTISVREIGTA